ncbi:MAG: tetratricopeptide repeat protein [Chitinophagaceae bacterium]|nr:MAG: tetratricopeptide repeat protein [Chitinophagaceae bacterium]
MLSCYKNSCRLIGCLPFFLLFCITTRAQDTAYLAIQTATDDTAKVMRLIRYEKTIDDTDTVLLRKLNQDVIRLSEKIGFPLGTGLAYMNIAYGHAAGGNEDEAIAYYRKALQFLRKTGNTETIAKCILSIGNCEEAKSNYAEATRLGIEAITLLENTPHKAMLARAYCSLGLTFYNIDNHSKALEYLVKALPVAKEVKDTSRLLMVLYGLSATMSSMEKIPEAKQYAAEAIKAATAYGKAAQLHIAHQSMADLLCRIEEGRKALPHALLSLQYAREAGSMHYIFPATVIVGEAYGKSGDRPLQVTYLKQALALAKESGIYSSVSLIYKGMSEAYEELGRHREALQSYKAYIVSRDSIQGEDTQKHIAELEVQYKTSQKEKTIAQKNLEVAQKEVQLQKSNQMTFYSIGSTLVALLVALLVGLHFRNKRKLHQRQLAGLQKEKELHLLQAIMQGEEKERSRIAKDLHDGVAGMLAATKMHVSSIASAFEGLEQAPGYRQAMELLNEASHEVRKTAHNLMPEVLNRYGLDEALRRYCSTISNENRLKVEYDFLGRPTRFVSSFELSVYRIVQELLTNVIKHSKASEAVVQVSQQDDCLFLTVEDNGVGIPFDNTGENGMGLHSLRARVEAMDGKFDLSTNGQSGVSAYLEFDISELKKEPVLHHEYKNTVGNY